MGNFICRPGNTVQDICVFNSTLSRLVKSPHTQRWKSFLTVELTFILQQYLSFSWFRKPSSSCRSLLSSFMSGCRDRLPMILSLSRWNGTHLTTFHAAALCRHWRISWCFASGGRRNQVKSSVGFTRTMWSYFIIIIIFFIFISYYI